MQKLLLGGMLLPLLLAACTGPIPAYTDPITGRTQVTVTEYWLQNMIRVQPLRPERVGAGQLKVSIEIRSFADYDLPLDYQYHFYDQTGHQTYVSGWQLVRLPRKGNNTIDFTSMDPAADFSVELRTAK